jgi:hypothetical protein
VLPELRIAQHVDRAGNRVGLGSAGGGWSGAVRLSAHTTPDVRVLISVLRDAMRSTTIPLASARLVVWTVPGPPQPADPRGYLPNGSYQRIPPSAARPIRVYWLAVRYRPDGAPHATLARGGGETGAMRATASALLALSARLDGAGYQNTVLDQGTLGQELMVALGVAGPSSGAANETWHDWSTGAARQVCYQPTAARARGTSGPLDDAEAALLIEEWLPSAAFSCVSYTLSRTARGQLRARLAVRVGSGGQSGPGGRPMLPDGAFGGHPAPANGRQRRHVRRTLPLAIPD